MTAPSQSPGAAEAQYLTAWANDIDGGRGAAVYSVDAERLRKCAALLSEHDRLTEEVARLREECAKVADEYGARSWEKANKYKSTPEDGSYGDCLLEVIVAREIAAAIRARAALKETT